MAVSTVFLRKGQMVRTKLTRGMLWRIESVIVPAGGERVLELVPFGPAGKRGRIYAGASEVELIDEAMGQCA